MSTEEKVGSSSDSGSAWNNARNSVLLRAWGLVLIAYCLISLFGNLSYRAGSVLNDVAWTFSAALAAWSSYRASRSLTGADRRAWLSFFAASLAWTVGQLAWDYYEIVREAEVPFPSYADIGYLAFGPLMIVGLLFLRATQRQRRFTWLRVANLSLILCSFAIVLLITMTQPFGESTQSFVGSLIVLGENGLVAVALLISIYLVWSYQWGDRLLPVSLITIGLGAQMIAAVLYARELVIADYDGLSFFNFLWVVAFALHQCAAEMQLRISRQPGPDQTTDDDQGQVWVEVLVPSMLVLCIAVSSYFLAAEMVVGTIHLGAIVLSVFAVILGLRESWVHAQGRRLRGALGSSASELARSRTRLQALEARHHELERVIEMTARAGGVGLWEWDVRANVVRLSSEWKRQLGYKPEELPDHYHEWSRRLHPEDRERTVNALQAFLASPSGEYVSEHRLQHRDGSYRWMLARGMMLLDETGRPSRMMGSQIDISGFKELEASLRESEASLRESEARYRELAEALESRVNERTEALSDAYRESRSFAYAVAHDLRAPLRAINGYNAMLYESAHDRLTDKERDLVSRVGEGSIRMSALIDGLLDYSRVEHRDQRIAELDCNDCLDQVLKSMAGAIETAQATIQVSLDQAPVLVDREGLAIILRNLIDNALKFASPHRALRIRIDSVVEQPQYLLRVSDNGIGFSSEYQEKVFEIFHRLNPSAYAGTGMGLALVRKAASRMGGRVWAESELNRGSTFYVALVLARQNSTGQPAR
jgi:PAS domain S-box-containing protein